MKYPLFSILFCSICLFSCTTAYRNMQTPDDVYYSTGRPDEGVIEDNTTEYQTRMKCRDRRWRDMDDDFGCGYGYDPYHYGYHTSYYYNPHYYPYPVFWYTPVINSTPRITNLGSYYNTTRTIVNTKTGESTTLKSTESYNNSNTNTRLIRSLGNSGNSSGGERTYSPSGGSSTSFPSGSSISRPSRN